MIENGIGSVVEDGREALVVDGFVPLRLIFECVRHSLGDQLGDFVFQRMSTWELVSPLQEGDGMELPALSDELSESMLLDWFWNQDDSS